MKPAYKTVSWLFWRGILKQIIKMTDQDIQTKTHEIEAVVRENIQLYNTAETDRLKQRQAFRDTYPRRNFPNYLRESVEPPPLLLVRWRKLLHDREKHFRNIEQEREEQKSTFLNRMENGRIQAMQRREHAVRDLINQAAKAQGITLSERATDLRLAELLDRLTKVDAEKLENEADNPLVMYP